MDMIYAFDRPDVETSWGATRENIATAMPSRQWRGKPAQAVGAHWLGAGHHPQVRPAVKSLG